VSSPKQQVDKILKMKALNSNHDIGDDIDIDSEKVSVLADAL